jgi:wobble nucleotide-excising tRNase
MIEKFIKIKSIGTFRDCTPSGDVALRKLNLIFAENGLGKTTLCAILRSLQGGFSEYITERKTIGISDLPFVQIRLIGSMVSFSNNAWSTTHPNIAIFDSVFIHDNVYAGDYVDHEHKKNLYRVIVGAQGVQLAQQVDSLDEQIRTVNADIRAKEDVASRFIPQGVALKEYLDWQAVEDIDARILQKNDEIIKRQQALDKAGEILAKGLLMKVQLPLLPSDFSTILAKQLTDIVIDAETLVRQHITNHAMGNQGESWLSQGLGYVCNDQCPFCGQVIAANDLILAYRSYFNAAYKNLKQEVAQLDQLIISAIGDSSLNAIRQALSGNLTLVEFWKQFSEVILPELSLDEVQANYATLRQLALGLARKKQENPTEIATPDETFTSALKSVQELQNPFDSYNAAVDACNTRMNELKASVQQGGDITVQKHELAVLDAKKKRFEPDVINACIAYQALLKPKADLERQKKAAKQRLDKYCEDILPTYQKAINDYLDQFNAGFRIINTKRNYQGGSPRAQFQIQINNIPVDLGDAKTPFGTPCFKTTLSSGDRSALALAFFLGALKQDINIGNRVAVLDDPFTSLDRFRRTCTQQLIVGLVRRCQQVIILSHDPDFLKLISDECPAGEVKTLQLCRTGGKTMLGEWDIETETQSTYLKNYSILSKYYRDRTGTPLDVARSIRPFLEGMLRAHFPGAFQPNEWLGDFIKKIRDADSSSGLQHAKDDLSELEAINDYSKKFHHNQDQNTIISSDELYGFVKRTLRLVGGC